MPTELGLTGFYWFVLTLASDVYWKAAPSSSGCAVVTQQHVLPLSLPIVQWLTLFLSMHLCEFLPVTLRGFISTLRLCVLMPLANGATGFQPVVNYFSIELQHSFGQILAPLSLRAK